MSVNPHEKQFGSKALPFMACCFWVMTLNNNVALKCMLSVMFYVMKCMLSVMFYVIKWISVNLNIHELTCRVDWVHIRSVALKFDRLIHNPNLWLYDNKWEMKHDLQMTYITNPRMNLFHIPQCSIQNRKHCGIWNRCILEFVKLLYW